jgi:Fe-S cluster biogenesis protein NfuA
MREKVEAAIAKIRSSLRGANVVLVDVNDGTVKVQILTSTCVSGIPKDIVLEIIEDRLKEQVPEVKEVVAI